MPNALGEKIRELRKQQNLTLEQLATRAGASKSYIWELENKNPPRPSAEKLSKIAAELGTTIEYLLDDSGEIPVEDATDASFYREYKKKSPETKEKIRKMLDLWGDDG